MREVVVRLALVFAALASTATTLRPAYAAPAATGAPPTSADDAPGAAFVACTALSSIEAASLLGYDVSPLDTHARSEGNCFFDSQSISEDGSLSYSLMTAAKLATEHPYFVALARRCAGVVPSSPRAPACALYVKLASVSDVDAYYAARTSVPGALPDDSLGDGATSATSAAGTLFVRCGSGVLEATVRRDGAFDLKRSEALARLLLERLTK